MNIFFLKVVQIRSKIGFGSKLGSNIHVCPRKTWFENYQKWQMDSWISSTVRYILFIQFLFFFNFLFLFNFFLFHDSHGSHSDSHDSHGLLARTLDRPPLILGTIVYWLKRLRRKRCGKFLLSECYWWWEWRVVSGLEEYIWED